MYDFSLCRQEALLAAISEKDANIALLELSSSKKKKTQEEVAALKREKDGLVHQLKQQVGLLHTHQHTYSHIQVDTRKTFWSLISMRGAETEREKCGEGFKKRGCTGEVAMTRGAKKTRQAERN